MTEDTLLQQIAAKKAELDRLRPQAPHGLENLNRSYDIELTYTSNAIEGNTLTAAETRMVIEHGVTIGGKPLRDHLEAVDHFEALRYVRDLAQQTVCCGRPTSVTCIASSYSARTPTWPGVMPTKAAMSKPTAVDIISPRRRKRRR